MISLPAFSVFCNPPVCAHTLTHTQTYTGTEQFTFSLAGSFHFSRLPTFPFVRSHVVSFLSCALPSCACVCDTSIQFSQSQRSTQPSAPVDVTTLQSSSMTRSLCAAPVPQRQGTQVVRGKKAEGANRVAVAIETVAVAFSPGRQDHPSRLLPTTTTSKGGGDNQLVFFFFLFFLHELKMAHCHHHRAS